MPSDIDSGCNRLALPMSACVVDVSRFSLAILCVGHWFGAVAGKGHLMGRSFGQRTLGTLTAIIGLASALGCSSGDPSEETAQVEEELAGDFLPTGNMVVMEAEHFAANVTQGGHSWVQETD